MNQIPKKKKRERLIEKHCMFVDEEGIRCKTIFFGTGKSKFCKIHRQPKFRKIIDKDKIIAKKKAILERTANITINHKYNESMEITRTCDCCGKEYTFILYPSVYIYPKYCEDHRNEWKRTYYYILKQNDQVSVN
ncbi:MAG: hypothetical protein QXG00_07625 [Candidatus Woesearchaeota archaeon]